MNLAHMSLVALQDLAADPYAYEDGHRDQVPAVLQAIQARREAADPQLAVKRLNMEASGLDRRAQMQAELVAELYGKSAYLGAEKGADFLARAKAAEVVQVRLQDEAFGKRLAAAYLGAR